MTRIAKSKVSVVGIIVAVGLMSFIVMLGMGTFKNFSMSDWDPNFGYNVYVHVSQGGIDYQGASVHFDSGLTLVTGSNGDVANKETVGTTHTVQVFVGQTSIGSKSYTVPDASDPIYLEFVASGAGQNPSPSPSQNSDSSNGIVQQIINWLTSV